MIRTAGAALIALAALARPLLAQDERWQVSLVRLDGDSLVVRQSDSLVRVPVSHMTELRLIRKSEAELGDGAAMAGAMSALVGGDDEVYDMTALDPPDRLRTVKKVLAMHPAEP
jgi:hypothetical protein